MQLLSTLPNESLSGIVVFHLRFYDHIHEFDPIKQDAPATIRRTGLVGGAVLAFPRPLDIDVGLILAQLVERNKR